MFDAVNRLIDPRLADLALAPRDGLMTGLVRRTGPSVRLVCILIEVSVVLAGFLLRGTLGLGTVAYPLLIGPLIQAMLPWFDAHLRATAGESARTG